MNKSELVELVFLAMAGGETSLDSSVHRVDIKTYMPIAYGSAMTEFYWEIARQRRGGEHQPLSMYYTCKTFPLIDGSTGDILLKAYLPVGSVSIGDKDIIFANGKNQAIQLQSYYKHPVAYIKGDGLGVVGCNANNLTVNGVFKYDTYEDDDEFNIPPYVQQMIIDKSMKHFFIHKRSGDYEVNNIDDGGSTSDK